MWFIFACIILGSAALVFIIAFVIIEKKNQKHPILKYTYNSKSIVTFRFPKPIIKNKGDGDAHKEFSAVRSLYTENERKFLRVLESIELDDLENAGKTRIADILNVNKNDPNWYSNFNKIKSKHVDFLIVTKKEKRPVVAIELDDSTHQLNRRKKRDQFVNALFEQCEIPLLRIPLNRHGNYNAFELKRKILDAKKLNTPSRGIIPPLSPFRVDSNKATNLTTQDGGSLPPPCPR